MPSAEEVLFKIHGKDAVVSSIVREANKVEDDDLFLATQVFYHPTDPQSIRKLYLFLFNE